MSSGRACRTREHRAFWRVVARNSNHSAFNGYHKTFSDYSAILCVEKLGGCGAGWRTRAAYVYELPDAPKDWYVTG